MNRTAKGNRCHRIPGAFLLVLALVALMGWTSAMAAEETMLTVTLKGVSTDDGETWRSLSISGRFDVQISGGQVLGQVRANPSAEQEAAGESDTLAIADLNITSVILVPVEEDFQAGFQCQGPIVVRLSPGERNAVAAVAYAQRGLFILRNTVAGTGATAAGAEFMLISKDGSTQLSFTTDEKGEYRPQHTLPVGEYRLMQMRSAEGTLPKQEATPVVITTYYGSETEVTPVGVENQPVPSHSHGAQVQVLEAGSFIHREEGMDTYAAHLQVRAERVGDKDTPLQDFTLTLIPEALVNSEGGDMLIGTSLAVESVTVDTGSSAVAASVQGLDAQGAALGGAQVIASGETAVLADAVGLAVTYVDSATREALVPAEYQPGAVEVTVLYMPGEHASQEGAVTSVRYRGEASNTYQYPGTDGNSLVVGTAKSQGETILVSIPDGKVELSIQGKAVETGEGAGEVQLSLATVDTKPLSEDTVVAASLPQGGRVDDNKRNSSFLLLRLADRDMAMFTLNQLKAGVTIPVCAGTIDQVELYIWDPQQRPKTQSNPQGVSILAPKHAGNPLLDTWAAKADSLYAVVDCPLGEGLSLPEGEPCDMEILTGEMYEDKDKSGSRTSDEAAAGQRGILLRGEQSNLYYGDITDEEGYFAIHGQQEAGDLTATLIVMLPDNTMSVGTRVTGRLEWKGLEIPDEEYPVSYIQMSQIQGQLLQDGTRPLPGAKVALRGTDLEVEAETDASGRYRFSALEQGIYQMTLSLPADGGVHLQQQENATLEDAYTLVMQEISLGYGEDRTIDFAAATLGQVKGLVTFGEEPRPNIEVTLTSADGAAQEAKTDSNGSYLFEDVATGKYTLTLALPEQVVVVSVNGVPDKHIGLYQQDVRVAAGTEVESSFVLEACGTVQGRIEALGGGQTISAASLQEQITTETGEDGSFLLENLLPGDYSVYAPMPQGMSLPAESGWQVTQRGDMIWIAASVRGGETAQLPMVEFVQLTSIEGVAYVDEDGDFRRGEGEQLMSGVTVALQRKIDGAWTDVGSTETDEYGSYAFRDLQAGLYRVASMLAVDGLYVSAVGGYPQAVGTTKVMTTDELDLSNGSSLQDVADVALAKSAALRVTAFLDSNENGLRGEYERIITGVQVEVLAEDGETVLASGTTHETGEAYISNIPPGTYRLRVALPEGYMYTQKGEGEGSGVSCITGDERVALSEAMRFTPGETMELGVGAMTVGSFSGKVWNDLNNNGLMDEEEPGVAGVTLTLAATKGDTSYTLVTDETGVYRFEGVRDGQYTFSATLPDHMLLARYTLEGGSLRSLFTGSTTVREFSVASGENVSNKNVGVIEKGVVQGIAFLDINYNGIQDEGEPGYAGVTLELSKENGGDIMGKVVTGEDGAYTFADLRGGAYRLRAILPNDGSLFSVIPVEQAGSQPFNRFQHREGRRENTIGGIEVGSGGTASTVVGVALGASVQGKVYLDSNYDGKLNGKEQAASGIKVTLHDAGGGVVATATTDANGIYSIKGIMPGAYSLHFLRKEGHAFTRFRPQEEEGSWVKSLVGSEGVTELIEIAMGESLLHINAGMLPSSTVAGVFFDDLNDNGLQDEGELGMEDVTVRLYSQEAEVDLTAKVQADGSYFFDGVMPGSYTLTYSLPEHVELASVEDGGNTLAGKGRQVESQPFQVEAGVENQQPLVGAVRLGSWEGYLFHDINGNGVQDQGEERLAGLKLTLIPGRSDVDVLEATAGQDGAFSLTGIRPGRYQLGLELPEGYIFSGNIKEAGLTLDTASAQKLTIAWAQLVSRKVYPIGGVRPGTITGSVWLDENRDQTQGQEEQMLSGLEFELIDEAQGKVVKSALSDEKGQASFTMVRPGAYTVRFTIPSQAEPAGEAEATMQELSGKMVQKGIVLAEGESFQEIHVGLVSRTSIGGVISLDEGGKRSTLGGITVRLYLEGQGEPLQTTTSGENGSYRFDGLWPGDYYMECQLSENMIFVRPGDPNYPEGASVITKTAATYGTSDTFPLQMANHQLRQDIILIRPAKVGDLAWLDSNGNGLLDGGEPVIPGVQVALVMDGETVMEAKTDASGYYFFGDVYPGTYTLRASAYPQLAITKAVPELRIISSCLTVGDGQKAESDPFTVESGATRMDFDLGYILQEGQTLPEVITTPPDKDWTGSYVSGGGTK